MDAIDTQETVTMTFATAPFRVYYNDGLTIRTFATADAAAAFADLADGIAYAGTAADMAAGVGEAI